MTPKEAVDFAMEVAQEKKREAHEVAELPRRRVATKDMVELRSGCFRQAVAELYGGGSRYAERLED